MLYAVATLYQNYIDVDIILNFESKICILTIHLFELCFAN